MEILAKAFDLIVSGDADLLMIVALSLRVSLTSCLIATIFAVPIGALLAVSDFRGKRPILVAATAMMALPPVVVGLVVYLTLSRSGPLGDLGLLFTPTAMIIAQTILIFPIILALTHEAILPVERDYRNLFAALDTPALLRLRTLILDARFAVFTAMLAGFGRALAEVGAVIIVGGNINGATRVMTTTIALETSKGNLELALALGIILILVALTVNAIIHLVASWGRRYQVTR